MTAPFSPKELSDFLAGIEPHMTAILDGSANPYDAGREIWGSAFKSAPRSPEVAWPLWLIWGALTDVVETQPARRAEADEQMRRAAQEWLALPGGDAVARTRYLDRWVYDELGYERKGQ